MTRFEEWMMRGVFAALFAALAAQAYYAYQLHQLVKLLE